MSANVQRYQLLEFYIRGSLHRNSRLKKSKEMQQYADIYLLINHSTCFGCPSHPSSGLNKIVTAASGTDHTIWAPNKDRFGTIGIPFVPNRSLFGDVGRSLLPR